MGTKSCTKVANFFCCESCDYSTSRKSSWMKHLATQKHSMVINGNEKLQKVANLGKIEEHNCEFCGKKYKFSTGLCRHKKTCAEKNDFILVKKEEHLEALVKAELYEAQKEDINDLKTAVNDLVSKDTSKTTIINNNNLNINIILNDQCKNAMNLTQFVDQIKLTFDDLFYTKNNGYIEGVSNIFIKNLQEMEPTQRPIHCSNKKGNQLYIKDDDKWEKDDGLKLNVGIGAVTKKHINALVEWEDENPKWQQSEKLTQTYMELVQKIMGGTNNSELEKNHKSIKKKISKKVNISDVEV